jgi:hypothetical protein
MALPVFQERPIFGHTFSSAMWLLGVCALVEVAAFFWAIWQIPPGLQARPVNSVAVPEIPAGGTTLVPAGEATIPGGVSVSSASSPPSLAQSPDRGVVTPLPLLSDEPIEDAVVERLVIIGEELQAKGSLAGALQNFRQAESVLPDHPRILAGLAATLEGLGQAAEALPYLRRLAEFGARPAALEASTPVPPVAASARPILKIGEVKVNQQSVGPDGQHVSLRIIIEAEASTRPIGEDLSLIVFFYDEVTADPSASNRIESSTADTSYLYPTEPYDWQVGGREEIVVNYHQPQFTEEETQDLGNRSYYGYVIELYYQDRLQDRIVVPEAIDQIRPTAPTAPIESAPSTFPSPDSSLFPSPPRP